MNILVTGASKGIGNAIAQELQNVGEVYVTGRNEQALAAWDAKGFCICDLSKDVNNLANFIIEKNIDVLINKAGEYIYSGLETMNIADIQRLYQTNLIAPAYLISKAIPLRKVKVGKNYKYWVYFRCNGWSFCQVFILLQKQDLLVLQKVLLLN